MNLVVSKTTNRDLGNQTSRVYYFRNSENRFDKSEKLKGAIGYHASQNEETVRTSEQINTANCDSAAKPNSNTQTVKQKHTRTDVGLRSRI